MPFLCVFVITGLVILQLTWNYDLRAVAKDKKDEGGGTGKQWEEKREKTVTGFAFCAASQVLRGFSQWQQGGGAGNCRIPFPWKGLGKEEQPWEQTGSGGGLCGARSCQGHLWEVGAGGWSAELSGLGAQETWHKKGQHRKQSRPWWMWADNCSDNSTLSE